jgi:archaellum component FlaG (FlaF/FlaG flagellin family)
MSELTTLVQSKGAKLPVGAVLESAVAIINDLGAIVASYDDANNALVIVRPTAKP